MQGIGISICNGRTVPYVPPAPSNPVVSSAHITDATPSEVVIVFDQALNDTIVPATTDFALAGKSISLVSIVGDEVRLTVSVPYAFGDVVTVDYTAGANPLTGLSGGLVASFSGQAVTNNIAGILITITTTLTGDFNIDLDGVGTCTITWPDLTTTDVVMTGAGAVRTTKTITPGTITISNPVILTYFDVYDINDELFVNDITGLTGLEYCPLIQNLIITGSFASFTTSASWTALSIFAVPDCPSLTTLATHAEWTALSMFAVIYCPSLTTLATHAEWTALSGFEVSRCPSLTTLATHAEWTALSMFAVSDCPSLTTLATHAEWTALSMIEVAGCALTESSVNGILTEALASGITSGNVDLTGGTNAAPTGAGITAADALNALGVVVTANGYTYP